MRPLPKVFRAGVSQSFGSLRRADSRQFGCFDKHEQPRDSSEQPLDGRADLLLQDVGGKHRLSTLHDRRSVASASPVEGT